MVSLILISWLMVSLLMLVLWMIQARTKNASYVDLGWTLGLLICCSVYASQTGPLTPRKMLILLMVGLWAVRLGALLVSRLVHDSQEDRRYARMRQEWKTNQNVKFFFMFQFQALLDVVLSWGFLLICLNPSPVFHPLEYLAVVLWNIGFIGEHTADKQLKEFKSNPQNKGKTCQEGLWYYSRHPNYFFEWLMWLAYFMMALPSTHGWTAVILPGLMYYFLMHVSGVPLAEAQALQSRKEEYRLYQQTTSMFVPLPKGKAPGV